MALVPDFGDDYIQAQINGNYIFRKELQCRIQKMSQSSPEKYVRPIDAALIEDEIYIVYHSQLYSNYFRPFFKFAYPHSNCDQIRSLLNKLVEPRNLLMHSNPISIRQAEQVLCYSYDMIESIKSRMLELNMGQEYNAPRIIRLFDSTGRSVYESQIRRNNTGRGHFDLTALMSTQLRAGDKLSIEVEIDLSFPPDSYRIRWTYANPASEHSQWHGKRITIELQGHHVREDFTVYCTVTSLDQSWHRCGDVDDSVSLVYKILPPL